MRRFLTLIILAVLTIVLPIKMASSIRSLDYVVGYVVDVKSGTPPTLDGVVSVEEWSDAAKVIAAGNFTSTIYLKYDETYLYMAFDIPFRGTTVDWAAVEFDLRERGVFEFETDLAYAFPSRVNRSTGSRKDSVFSVSHDPVEYRKVNVTRKQGPYTRTEWVLRPVNRSFTVFCVEMEEGWQAELRTSLSSIGLYPGHNKTIGLCFAILSEIEKREGYVIHKFLAASGWPLPPDYFRGYGPYGEMTSSDFWGPPGTKPLTSTTTTVSTSSGRTFTTAVTSGESTYTTVLTSTRTMTTETLTSTPFPSTTGISLEQPPILGVLIVVAVSLSVIGLIASKTTLKGASGATYMTINLGKHFASKAATCLITLVLAFLLNFFLFYRLMPYQMGSPIFDQFSSYVDFVFVKGFGNSLRYSGTGALDIVAEKLPWTLLLMGLSLPIAVSIGILTGALASWAYGKRLDTVISWSLLASYATPTWLVAIFFIIVPCFQLRLFPIGGFYSDKWLLVSAWSDPVGYAADVMWHLAPAAMVLAIGQLGLYFLVTKNGMADVFDEPYIFAAMARGLRPRSIVFKHALRNAALPIVTVMAFSPVLVMTATILVEMFFSKAGVGWLLINSIERSDYFGASADPDYPVLQATFMTLTVIVVLASLIAETLYGYLDPRIRRGEVKMISFDERPMKGPRTTARVRWRHRLKGIAGALSQMTKLLSTKSIRSCIRKAQRSWGDYRRSRSGLIGLCIILFFIVLASFAPLFPYDPNALELEKFQPPSFEHWLGTDENGRDVLTRLAWGAQASLTECLGAVVIATFVGCLLGSISGFYDRRWFSYLIDRITDLFLSVPLIALIIFFPFERELYSMLTGLNIYWTISPLTFRSILLTGITTWGITAKLVRARVLSAKEKAYVEGVKAAGAGGGYILFRHIFPEAVRVAFSSVFYTAVIAITLQSSLDILGFQNPWRTSQSRGGAEMAYGTARSPVLTWGTMISWTVLFHPTMRAWWAILAPGISLALLALSLILVGNTVSDLLNPLKRERVTRKFKPRLTFR